VSGTEKFDSDNDGEGWRTEVSVTSTERTVRVKLNDLTQFGDMDGWAELSPDEADRFAAMLQSAAKRVRRRA
jgi:hypothetical protein